MSDNLPVRAPFAGTVVAIRRDRDDPVTAGEPLVVLEAMKMEHEIAAEVDGTIRSVEVSVGDTVDEGQLLAVVAPGTANAGPRAREPSARTQAARDDLAAVKARHEQTLDAARPGAVAKGLSSYCTSWG